MAGRVWKGRMWVMGCLGRLEKDGPYPQQRVLGQSMAGSVAITDWLSIMIASCIAIFWLLTSCERLHIGILRDEDSFNVFPARWSDYLEGLHSIPHVLRNPLFA